MAQISTFLIRWQKIPRNILVFLSSGILYIILLLTVFIIISLLVWRSAIAPIVDDTPATSQADIVPVSLQQEDIKTIIEGRGKRVGTQGKTFDRFNGFFGAIPTTSPSPSISPSVTPTP